MLFDITIKSVPIFLAVFIHDDDVDSYTNNDFDVVITIPIITTIITSQ